MQTKILLLILIFINPIVLFSQATISYITPDVGAKGHSQYLEIIGPHDSHGSFGEDGVYVNGINTDDPSGDVVIVETVDPADSNKITFGPVMVNWDGRMLSTYVFVNPNMANPNTNNWETLDNEFIIDIRVRVNGAASNSKRFYILQPFTFGDISGNPNRVLGRPPLGIRSPGGAMIVDDLTLADDTYTVNTDDCDPNTPGNQGFLPFTLISLNEIKGSGSNSIIDVSAPQGFAHSRGGDGGPGGGGGGGKFCDRKIIGVSSYGDHGGNGFTGGGRGGSNGSGIHPQSYKD